ncbi:hypothetical protein, partial [Klebsiella quasipneumoniae]|uniref:hypothetical protein n=1 Tax=Klebsiella quasipneumoniae TaxID=1463165 RepID=UPI0027319F2B
SSHSRAAAARVSAGRLAATPTDGLDAPKPAGGVATAAQRRRASARVVWRQRQQTAWMLLSLLEE